MTREFVDMIEKRGRSTESWISLKLYLRTRPTELVKNTPVGGRLMSKGRLGLRRESIKGRSELRTMLKAAAR
jgi:hypothetical protein